jgi:hypothetical protein
MHWHAHQTTCHPIAHQKKHTNTQPTHGNDDIPSYRNQIYKVDTELLIDRKNVAYREVFEIGLFEEHAAMIAINDPSPYATARRILYGAIISMVVLDPVSADISARPTEKERRTLQQYKSDMIEAGHILYNAEGDKGMYDPLLLSFIPRRIMCYLNMAWDGIGSWRW